jgi:hypothetical protein
MPQRVTPPLISRILMLLLAVACVLAAFWFGSQALEPVPIPPAAPTRSKVIFNRNADVSQNPTFTQLQPLGPETVEAGTLGRMNPFAPVIHAAVSSTAATSTPQAPLPETAPPPPLPLPPVETPPPTS